MRDETHRLAQYEALKDQMRDSVQTKVGQENVQTTAEEQARIDAAGAQLRSQSLPEIVEVQKEVARTRIAGRISQFVDFAFFLVYGVIALEIILDLMGANPRNAFRQAVGKLSAPLLWPFENLLADPEAGQVQFSLSYVVGLLAYALLHLTITKLLRLVAERKAVV